MKNAILISLVILFCACEKLDDPNLLISPVALEATHLTSNSFVANWTRSPGAGIYKIQVAINMDFTQIIKTVKLHIGTAFGIDGLNNNTEYFYRVRVSEGEITSKYSNIISVKLP
ncbi:MAG: fibronectin type III domain-containing protein [Bacteroidales bacterium]|nr:fibronectin type III domain-containing protein [Bacteroidales bacterium]